MSMPIRAEHVRNWHVGWVAAGSRMILGYDDEEVKHSVKMREAFEYAKKTRHLRPHEEPILMSITIAEQEDLCMQIPESLPLVTVETMHQLVLNAVRKYLWTVHLVLPSPPTIAVKDEPIPLTPIAVKDEPIPLTDEVLEDEAKDDELCPSPYRWASPPKLSRAQYRATMKSRRVAKPPRTVPFVRFQKRCISF